MKEKTKKRWERAAVWLIIVGFVFGSIAVYLIGIVAAPNDVSNPAYTPPALDSVPAQEQPPAAGTTQSAQ